MAGAAAIVNRKDACDLYQPGEGLTVLTSGNAEQIVTEETFVRSVSLSGVNAFAGSGAPTANSANVYVGFSAARCHIEVAPGKTVVVKGPNGARFDLSKVWFQGTTGDGLARAAS